MNDLQNAILDIFKNIKDICDKNGIMYFAIGGTCIGAVRHKGFIPWDDDLDIAIPIEEFTRFFEIAKKELRPEYEIYTCNDVKHYGYVFNKIHNAETTFIENSQISYKDAYKGVYVDIMPISGMPDNISERKKFCKKIRLYSRLNKKMRFPHAPQKLRGICISIPLRIISFFVKYNYFSDKIYALLKKYPFKSSNFTGYVWSMKVSSLTFPSEYFKETVDMPFEDTFIKCPKMYHEYLTEQFGDYMKIPDQSKQQKHSGIVDLKNSYQTYKQII